MAELFASINHQLVPRPEAVLREEIFVSARDAQQAGIYSSEQYCIFGIQPLMPGPKDEEFAARVVISAEIAPGTIEINQHFLAEIGFLPGDERFWFVQPAPAVIPIRQVVIEHPLDQGIVGREIDQLRFNRREFFVKRCKLVNPGQNINDLTLRMQGRASFYFRAIDPNPSSIQKKAILVFDEGTQINLFIPHRKSGVDMVVVVDGSGSMDHIDFVYDGRKRTRLDGVKIALDILFQVKLVSGSRVSSIAAVAFGRNAKMLYPFEIEMRKLVDESQLGTIRESVKLVNDTGLIKIGVDRGGTVISNALKLASDLLDLYAQENNEKIIILLSDGADWEEDKKDKGFAEVVPTSLDPSVLADTMHQDSGIRVHTVAISDERSYLDSYPQARGQKPADLKGSLPNKDLLRKIAEFTDGMFLESPTADQLARIFEELGVGALYPIN